MVTRIGGLASGMDVDTIVKGLMDAQRVPLDKLYQKKTYTEWQRDDYREMNTSLSELDNLIFDGIMMQKSYTQKDFTISDTNAVSIKNVNSISDISGTINVSQLASAATMVSTGKTDIDNSINKMSDLGIAAQKITIEAINKDGALASYSLDIASTDTLDSVISKINTNSGVTVFYDKTSQRFSITAKYTGDVKDKAEIKLSSTINDTTGFFTKLKMSTDNVTAASTDITDSAGNATKAGTAGLNAKVTYNGLAIERTSNTFTINGAEFTVKKVTPVNTPVTFSSTPNVDAAVDTIKKFVDKYNEVIAKIKGKTEEKKDANFLPLTTAQKKDMKDEDIKLWEAKARKGTLRNDSTLTSLLTTMRSSIYTSVSGTSFKNMSELGITTTSTYQDGGKLKIDETKLRAKISENANGVYELFTKDSTTAGEQGIAMKLRANLSTAMKGISEKAGKTTSVNNSFTLGRLLNDYNSKITSFEDRLTSLENRYYKQFTAMEKAIQNANSQSASLSSFLGN